MKKRLTDQYYLESAPIRKTIAHLSIPMMIGLSVTTVYNMLNIFFIGLLRNTDMLSAITLGLPILTILMAFGSLFGVGGGSFVSRLIGQEEFGKAKRIAGYTFYGSVMAGVVIAFIAYLFIDPFVHLLGADGATFDYTKNYALILFAGGFVIVLNFALEQLVRSEGASRVSMYGMIISTLLSLILDPLFILVLDWHLAGAAFAMVLANLGSVIYYVYFLEKKSAHLKGFIKHLKISIPEQLEIYKVGVSELLQFAFMIVTTLFLNRFAVEYGDQVMAGFGVALRIVQIPEFLSMGLCLGMIPFFANNFGSKNFDRFNAGLKQTVLWIGTISVFFLGIVYVFREPIFKLFSKDASLLSLGTYIMATMLISAVFNGFTELFTGVFQATGQGTPLTIMSITQGVLFIPVIIVLHYLFGLHGVIWSMVITEVITSLLGAVLFILFKRRIHQPKVGESVSIPSS